MKRSFLKSQLLKTCSISSHKHLFLSTSIYYSSLNNNIDSKRDFSKVFQKEYNKLLDTKIRFISKNSLLESTPLFDDLFITDLKNNILRAYHKNKYYMTDESKINEKIDEIMKVKKDDFNSIPCSIMMVWALPYLCMSEYLLKYGSKLFWNIQNSEYLHSDTFVANNLVSIMPCMELVLIGVGLIAPFYISRKILKSIKWDYIKAKYFGKK